jgi:hypothetical protein
MEDLRDWIIHQVLVMLLSFADCLSYKTWKKSKVKYLTQNSNISCSTLPPFKGFSSSLQQILLHHALLLFYFQTYGSCILPSSYYTLHILWILKFICLETIVLLAWAYTHVIPVQVHPINLNIASNKLISKDLK